VEPAWSKYDSTRRRKHAEDVRKRAGKALKMCMREIVRMYYYVGRCRKFTKKRVEENMHGPVHRMGYKLSLLGLKLLCGANSPQMTFRAADASRTMPIESLR